MEIEYSREHWEILKNKRERAIEILRQIKSLGMEGYIYGSVARGDVKKDSDIDFQSRYVKDRAYSSSS